MGPPFLPQRGHPSESIPVERDVIHPACPHCASGSNNCGHQNNPSVATPSRALTDSSEPALGETAPPKNPPGWIAPTHGYGLQYSLLDLELMHKFAMETCHSLYGDENEKKDWESIIPQHASSHHFLMHGILAIAALHTAATAVPGQVLLYLNTAARYNQMSLGPFRQALDGLSLYNCYAVFAQSIITSVVGMTLPQLLSRQTGEDVSMVDSVVTVIEQVHGSKRICQIAGSWLEGSIFSKYDLFLGKRELNVDMKMHVVQLGQLNDRINGLDSPQHRVDQRAVDSLTLCYARFNYSPHPVSVLAWLGYLNEELIDGLRTRRPFSIVCLAYWATILKRLGPQFWWARECGHELVAETNRILNKWNSGWKDVRTWPEYPQN